MPLDPGTRLGRYEVRELLSMRSLLTVLSLILLADASSASLPSDACLRQLRSARIDVQRGEREAAQTKLHEAAEACPDSLLPVAALVGLAADAGRDALLQRLDERLADPQRPPNLAEIQALARQQDADGDVLLRILSYLQGKAEASKDPAVFATLGALQERLGDFKATAAALEKLAQLQPNEELSWHLVRLYRRLERPADEARWLKAIVEKAPEWREDYVQALSRAGDVKEVRRQIALLDERPPSWTVLETIQLTEGRKIDPNEIPTYLSAGMRARVAAAWNLYDAGLDEASEALFVEALDANPDDATLREILLNLFGSAEDRRRYAESKAARWEQVDDPQALFDEGTMLLTAGDAEAALPLLRRAAPGLHDLEAAWYNLGMAAYRVQEWETVDLAFARAAELNPERGAAFFFRGLALVELERCAEAVDELGRALELDPHRALAHYHRSVCLDELGDAEAAAAEMKLYEAAQQ